MRDINCFVYKYCLTMIPKSTVMTCFIDNDYTHVMHAHPHLRTRP